MTTGRMYAGFKTWQQTQGDLKELFEIWGVDPHDWSAMQLSIGMGAEIRWWLPYDDKPHIVSVNSQRTLDANLRVCFQFVLALQKNALRGVKASYGGQTYLALPAGDVSNASGDTPGASTARHRRGVLRGLRAACELLGVREDADREIVDVAYRTKAKRTHPDMGGSEEAMAQLVAAHELIYARRGWAVLP